MIQPINSPAGFEAVASYTPEAVKKQLDQTDFIQSDSPITDAFKEWVRRLHGVKTVADINKDNRFEYEKILFLCEHNLIFNLMFHHRYDLLHQLFSEAAGNLENPFHLTEPKDHLKVHQVNMKTLSTIAPKEIKTAELFGYIAKELDSERMKFVLWINLHQALEQLEEKRLIHQRKNYHDNYKELIEFAKEVMEDAVIDQSIRDTFQEIVDRSDYTRIRRLAVDEPILRADGALNLELLEQLKDKYDDLKSELFNLINKHPKVSDTYGKKLTGMANRHTQVFTETDRAIDEQKKPLLTRLNQLRSEMKFDQIIDHIKQTLERSKQKLRDKLTPNEQRAFTRVINELAALRQEMKSATTSEAMQSTFNKCHKKLDHFISQIKDNPAIATELEPLNKILLAFAAIAEQEPTIHNVWPEDAPVYTTTAEENDVIEMAIDEPPPPSKPSQVSQQQMRSALQEARKSSVSNREEVINIPEDELEDINEQLDELQEILRDLREVLVNGSTELLNTIEESFNALRVDVGENHIIRESMLNNLTQNIDTLEEQNSELKIVLNVKEKLLGLNEQITDYKDESPSQEARIDPSL